VGREEEGRKKKGEGGRTGILRKVLAEVLCGGAVWVVVKCRKE
jgi:hypothetical protein